MIGLRLGLGRAFAESGAAPFSPKTIAGCTLWLPFDTDLTQAPGTISAASDQSGAGIFTSATQAAAGKQPTYNATGLNGKPCLVGSANTGLDLGSASPSAGNKFSVFAVFSAASIPQYAAILARYYNAVGFSFGGAVTAANDGKIGFLVNTSGQEAISNGTLADGLTHTIVGTYDGSASPSTLLYVDGVLQTVTGTATGNLNASASDHIGVACETDPTNVPAQGWRGKLGEIAAWNVALSQANVNALRSYAQTKWAAA